MPTYNNIGETAIRTGSPRIRLPFQSHNDCQIVEEDYVQKASAYANATRLSASGTAAGSVVVSVGALYSITLSSNGSGYTSAPVVTVNGDGTSGAATAVLAGDKVTAINISVAGSGYTVATLSIGAPQGSSAWLRSDTNPDALLVEESGSRGIGAGLVQFTRVFSEVPPQRVEYEQVSFQQPGIFTTSTIQWKAPFTELQVATVVYDYFLTDAPEEITLTKASFSTEKTPTIMNGSAGVNCTPYDDALTRWRGDIWQRKQVTVLLQAP